MALQDQCAAAGATPNSSLTKRKTPSELRREQLKRRSSQDACPSQRLKCEASRLPRFIDTRSTDVPPTSKPKIRLSTLKDELGGDFISDTRKSNSNQADASTSKKENDAGSRFKNVTELSCRLQPPHPTKCVDMAEAIKVLGVRKAAENFVPRPLCTVTRSTSAPARFESQKTRKFSGLPLDLPLKIGARFISSTSFHWCHRLGVQNRFEGLKQFIQAGFGVESVASEKGQLEAQFWKGLHSWVYPQLPLPPAVFSALLAPSARAESSFTEQRQRDWEDSFHSLYYAFRNKLCRIFYFCTNQFVVVFLGGKSHDLCSAYLSRSTRGIRGILLKNDVSFSMPLCKMEANHATSEDLRELLEFEKLNPGQTRLVDSMAAVDNTVESLLAFKGSNQVHRLYDFLLNYRFFVGTAAGIDLPVLYSPVPFHNASLKVPEICSKQMQVMDKSASSTTNFSLELKDAFLAPWVISRLCDALLKLHSERFEVSFTTEPTSEGLNIAQVEDEVACTELGYGHVSSFGTDSSILQLKCTDGAYVASL